MPSTNATIPIVDWNAASASQAMLPGEQWKYTLTSNLTATGFTSPTEGCTIMVALLGCDGTHTFTFPSAKRFGQSDAAQTVITPTSGNHIFRFQYIGTTWYFCDTVGAPLSLTVALSDETTDITTGTAKVTMRAPSAMTIVAVRASLSTASSSGTPTVDIKEGGTTILSTKLTIDASELTSTTAATAAVISDPAIADDAELTFNIDTAGTGAKGLKVTLYYI